MATADNSQTIDPQDKVSLVRLCLGDLDRDDKLFTDAVIAAVLEVQPIVTFAAAALADSAAARFSREADIALGKTRISLSQKAVAWKDIAKCLRDGGPGDLPGGDGSGAPTLTMTVGGISKQEREDFLNDDDRIQPNFSLGMDDNPVGQPDRDDPNRRDGDC